MYHFVSAYVYATTEEITNSVIRTKNPVMVVLGKMMEAKKLLICKGRLTMEVKSFN